MDISDREYFIQQQQNTHFSSSHGIFTKIDHILGHKTYLNKFKRISFIQQLLSDHNKIRLEINNRKIPGNPKLCGS